MTNQQAITRLVDHINEQDKTYIKLFDNLQYWMEAVNKRDELLKRERENWNALNDIIKQKDEIIEQKDRLIKRLFVNSNHL